MKKISNYNCGYRIVSVSRDEKTYADLAEDNLDYIQISNNRVLLLPDNCCLDADSETLDFLQSSNNYDVFEIWPDGKLNRVYDASSIENYFFITPRCNSNCIMCPSSDASRQIGSDVDMDSLIEIAKHIPDDAAHLTLTGGEPFMAREKLFELLSFLQRKFIKTEFLLLTNGRIFSVDRYVALLKENMPARLTLGIPLHGSTPMVHDAITRADGSYVQTLAGLKKLRTLPVGIELRIVVNRLNADDIYAISTLIVNKLSHVTYVSIMAMEMTGNAYANRKTVWIPYKEAFRKIEPAIMNLLQNGIDVKLYNFPLCVVNPRYWMLCHKSISSDKVRFSPECENCEVRDACGGVFAGTYLLVKEELNRQHEI